MNKCPNCETAWGTVRETHKAYEREYKKRKILEEKLNGLPGM